MKHASGYRLLFGISLALLVCLPTGRATAQFSQLGGKLVGTGAVGTLVYQGMSVCISADGNTALVGATRDNGGIGAVWAFVRNGNAWSQQGTKLVGSGAAGLTVAQGGAVSLSADGNTAIVGGFSDNSDLGASWIFVRTGTTWAQQGNKLVGSGGVSFMRQGTSVALSADGNTAIVGGPYDNAYKGAAWVFTRSGSTWTQQGSKLVGSGGTATAYNGASVSLSADGNTAIIGGSGDAGGIGATWVFTRSGSVWTQQGPKLVGTGNVGNANQGSSVAVSADGNTLLTGAMADNSGAGAMWVFTRSAGVWSQQGGKLVGSGAVGIAEQGWSVSISADGNTGIIGGYRDNTYNGAAWVFTRSGGVWSQAGNKLIGTGNVGGPQQAKTVSISGDGKTIISGGPIDNGGAGAAWVFFNPTTDIRATNEVPARFALRQNYPNPFNPATVVSYQLPSASDVHLAVYDLLGNEVIVLVNQKEEAGTHEVNFNAARLASGTYFYRLRADNFLQTKKMNVVK